MHNRCLSSLTLIIAFQRRRDPIIAVYESQANLADHEKIQGTDGGVSAPRLGS